MTERRAATQDADGPIGRPLPRVEDRPLLTGEAPFVADLPIPALEAVFVRGPQTHGVTPSPDHPLSAKGIGESGAIGGPPAIVNAVANALRDRDTRRLRMPPTPERVLAVLGAEGRAGAPARSAAAS